jgi:Ice-binding-like
MTLTVDLGTAFNFAVLATTSVSSVGSTSIHGGNVGVGVGGTISGFPPGIISEGQIAITEAAQQAHSDVTVAYTEVQNRRTSSVLLPAEIGSLVLTPGLYYNSGAVTLATGNLVLNGAGVYVFQLTAALAVASYVNVVLSRGAANDQVFWQVGGAFSLGAGAGFQGTLMCNAAVGIGANTTIGGRLFTRAGAVSLSSTTLTCPDEVRRLQLIAESQKADLLTQSTSQSSFLVEMPDGSVVNGVHNFGDSLYSMVQNVLLNDTEALCDQINLSWQLAVSGGDLVTYESFQLLPSNYLFMLKPVHHLGQNRLESAVKPVNKIEITFISEYSHSVIVVDKRYCVRFYQREMNSWWKLGELEQVWLDVDNNFVAPTAKMSTVNGPVRVINCSVDQYTASQLPL